MFQYMLAPIEGYTDNALRKLCFNHGADLTFTEMSKIDALYKKTTPSLKKTLLLDNTPTQIQILPGREDLLQKYLQKFKPSNGFRGFNFNLGCPSPKIKSVGKGAGMVKEITKANRLIKIIKSQGFPVSIKMRLGETALEKKEKVYLNLIKETDPDFFIVHARSGEDTYKDSADYSVFSECIDTGKKIIANGDINTIKIVDELKKVGVSGVMIGRSAVTNPAIFDLLKENKIPSFDKLKEEYLFLAEKYTSSPRHKKNVLMRIGQN